MNGVSNAGKMEKLHFQAYEDAECSKEVKDKKFQVMYNPTDFNVSYGTDYEEITADPAKPEVKTKKMKFPEITLEFLIDGTAVGLMENNNQPINVAEKVNEFKTLCFNPVDSLHKAYYIRIGYGVLLYKTVFKSADIKFTLFKSDGMPLRAKVNARFQTVFDTEVNIVVKSYNSPDVTHQRTLKDHHSLIAMSNNIYERNDLYQEIAAFNNLNTFRRVATGTTLFFPPIEK